MESLTESGIRKAAILVACLDRAAADAILEQLGSEQAHRVRQAVICLDDIPDDEKQRVLDEFFNRKPQKFPEPTGIDLSAPLEREFSTKYASYQAWKTANVPETNKPFERLREAEGEKIAKILVGELPQTIALVLAHLPSRQAGEVLCCLQSDVQVEVVKRLVELEETDPAILQEVEQAIESRLSQQVRMKRRRVAGLDAINNILDASDGEARLKIVGNLSSRDRLLARRIMPPPMPFDNLADLDDYTLTEVFRTAEPQWFVPALLSVSPEFQERVLGLLPKANAQLLRRKIQQPGPIRLSDIDSARRRIAEVATRIVFAKKRSFLGAA